ncbi:MAG: recombinase family protein [Pirellulales bacterium]|nr:recombinase family protein [Pirellulales bacterium]
MSFQQFCWCGIYTRQSRASKGGFSSCQAQFVACYEFLRARFDDGWVCNGRRYDDEGESSDSLDRPGLNRLLADIDAGKVDRVVVYKLDRLSRSIADCLSLLQKLRDRNIPITFVTSPELGVAADDTFILNILASFAEFERTMIRDRFTEARSILKHKGRRVAGMVPYGYTADPFTKQLNTVPSEARRVSKMFQWAAEGKTPSEIAGIANRRRWRTKARLDRNTGHASEGGRWTPRQILATLANPTYAGLIRNGDATLPGIHEALVELEIFEQVQELVDSRRTRKPGRKARQIFLSLRGRVFCGQCGRIMSPSTSGYKTFRYYYYRCRSHAGGRPPCRGVSVSANEIERYVLKLLAKAKGWQSESQFSAEQKEKASTFAAVWSSLEKTTRYKRLPSIIYRVVFNARHGTIAVTLDDQAVESLFQSEGL